MSVCVCGVCGCARMYGMCAVYVCGVYMCVYVSVCVSVCVCMCTHVCYVLCMCMHA